MKLAVAPVVAAGGRAWLDHFRMAFAGEHSFAAVRTPCHCLSSYIRGHGSSTAQLQPSCPFTRPLPLSLTFMKPMLVLPAAQAGEITGPITKLGRMVTRSIPCCAASFHAASSARTCAQRKPLSVPYMGNHHG